VVFLIAEDNARMRESIKRYLSSRVPDHHTIYEAVDGADAVMLYERVRPDWVMMGIMMEPVDGLIATRTIRKAHPDARIMILATDEDARYRKAAHNAGAQAFVLKDHLDDIPMILSEIKNGCTS
jgi:two-component system, NarL family, response regulator LiaR